MLNRRELVVSAGLVPVLSWGRLALAQETYIPLISKGFQP